MAVKRQKFNIVQSVDRALIILEEISRSEKREIGVTELGNKLALHKSTVHRLLSTLLYRGYVEQNPESDAYILGKKIIELSSRLLEKIEVRNQARPYLEELMRETGETTHLVIRDGDEGIYIDKVESRQAIRMHSEIGKRIPLYCTSVGKVLLSALDRERIERLYQNKQLKSYTGKTITDCETLFSELEQVRKQGYAVDDAEYEKDVRCIAAPIKNHQKETIAAMSVSGPTYRVTDARLQEMTGIVRQKALMISERLGYME